MLYLAQASTVASKMDWLFFLLTGLCALVSVAVFALMIYFAVKYRRGSKADRSNANVQSRKVEYAWTLIPFAIFLGIFVWAADFYYELFTPPDDALDIYVVGKQWMWKVQHPEGRREINQLHVPRGRDVKLTMTSQDVIHSFFIPAFRVKHDVLPGTYTYEWFNATQNGSFHLFCAEYCGTDHSAMVGRVVVMDPAEYERWLRRGDISASMASAGKRQFRAHGCSGCHGASATVHAPKLQGLYGRPVPLASGKTVIADERYIHDSIVMPKKDIAAGYPPIMPSFEGQIGEETLLQIVAYIKSLGPDEEVAE